MNKSVKVISIGLLIALISFGYGLATAKLRLPPYSALKQLADSSQGQAVTLWVARWFGSDQGDPSKSKRGDWELARDFGSEDLSNEDLARLEALGYLDGSELAPGQSGVVRFDQTRSEGSINLYNSGHGQVAVLMDSEGRVRHKWSADLTRLIEPDELQNRDGRLARLDMPVWRRVQMVGEGDLIAIYDGIGMARLDKNSKVVWFSDEPVHHDFFVDDENDLIYALSRRERMYPRFSSIRPIIEDLIVVLDSEGNVLRRLSLVEALEDSDYFGLFANVPDDADVFHSNSLELLRIPAEEDSRPFKDGDLLISIRHLDAVVAVDLELGKVVWALTGLWRWQHDPTKLGNGNVLVFDNRRDSTYSRVLEVDPLTQEIDWMYRGTPENGFFSATNGAAQRLEGGNTLITESDAGRAFEVTPEGEIVWEFINPARAGENNELIATLFEVQRLPANTELTWLSD